MPVSENIGLGKGLSESRMLVHGVAKLDFKCTFKSKPMFSDKSYKITGTTKDSSGNALAGCTVHLFDASVDILISIVQSDASGAFMFLVSPSTTCYILAYKTGSPDVAGTTVNTLMAL
ncbi:MAG: hypothetical protein ABSA44_09845 [Bacteroidota bacterium]|jgi:hypothetical protein